MSNTQIGPFILDSVCGQGGMGEVWLAHHATQGVPVAIKVIQREGAQQAEFVESFRNEVRAMARLSHPGIISLLDYGAISDEAAAASGGRLVAHSAYLAMEYAYHGSLHDIMRRLSWDQIQAVLFLVLDALAHAHAHGVIHRDLKPQNILLGCGAQEAMKLTDFGLAHALNDEAREGRFEEVWGTPQYMAPEQIRGTWRDYGPWTDLYALGCMTYEMVTGQPPFLDDGGLTIWKQHLIDEVPPLVPLMQVPEGLDRWLLRLLQKEPHQRFQRAADAAFALARLSGLSQPMPSTRAQQIVSGYVGDREYNFLESVLQLEDSYMSEATEATAKSASTSALVPGMAPLEFELGAADSDVATIPFEISYASDASERPARGVAPQKGSFSRERTAVKMTLSTLDWTSYAEQAPASAPAPSRPFERPRSASRRFGEDNRTRILPVEFGPVPFPRTWRKIEPPRMAFKLLGTGLAQLALQDPPLVGRQQERDLIWDALDGACQTGDPAVVILYGEPGVGTTRLTQWMAARAHELGACTILSGGYHQVATTSDGLAPMLARHIRSTGLDSRHTLIQLAHHLKHLGVKDGQRFKELGALLGEQEAAHAQSSGPQAPQQSNLQRFDVILSYLELLMRERPLIVCLDDVHWGAEALLFIRHVTRQSANRRLPILFLLTVHYDESDDLRIEQRLIDELASAPGCVTCAISPMEPQKFQEFLHACLPLEASLVEELTRRSQGVPMFALQLLQRWVELDALEDSAEGYRLISAQAGKIPDDIHAIMQSRLDALLRRDRYGLFAPLAVAAALGSNVLEAEWVEACVLRGVSLTPEVRQLLVERRLLQRLDADTLGFAQPMMRESLERHLRESGQWADCCAACASALVARYGEPPLAHLERYARLLLDAGLVEQALQPLLTLAQQHVHRGDLLQTHQLLDQRESLLESLKVRVDDPRSISGWILRARVHDLQGRYIQAVAAAEQALQSANHARSEVMAWQARLQIAWSKLHQGLTDEAEVLFGVCVAAEAVAPDATARLSCHVGLAMLRYAQGELEQANTMLFELLQRAQQEGDLYHTALCYNGLSEIARQQGHYIMAENFGQQAIALAERLGNRLLLADCFNDLAELHRLLGDYHEAQRLCMRSMALFESVESDLSQQSRLEMAYVSLARREYERALDMFWQLSRHFLEVRDFGQLTLAIVGMLPIFAFEGDWARLESVLAHAITLLQQTRSRDQDIEYAVDMAAQFAAQAERPDIVARLRALRQE